MREYVRVPIPIPTGVLLRAYKLEFCLTQNFLGKKIKIRSVWAHRTVRYTGLASGGSATVLPVWCAHNRFFIKFSLARAHTQVTPLLAPVFFLERLLSA
jgi:hypothetical protein